MIYLVAYLWVLLAIAICVMAHMTPHGRTGWSLIWRAALSPVLLPYLIISGIVKGSRK